MANDKVPNKQQIYTCKFCGAFWVNHIEPKYEHFGMGDSWQLISKTACLKCDNSVDFIENITPVKNSTPVEVEGWFKVTLRRLLKLIK